MKKTHGIWLFALAVILSALMLTAVCCADAPAVVDGGWALTANNDGGVTNDFKWQLDSEGTLSFYNEGTLNSTELNIDDGNYNGWGWNQPWKNNRSSIKKIIIPASVETIAGYAIFGNLSNLETVVIESEKITLHSATGAFANCPKLSAFGPEGTPKGTFDIKNIVWRENYSSNSASDNETFFGNCASGLDVTVLLPTADKPCFPYTWNGTMSFKQHDWKSASSVTFKYIPGSVGEDAADVYIAANSTRFSKKPYGEGEIFISGEGSCTKSDQGWTTNFTYSLDAVTGHLTFAYVSNNKDWPIFATSDNTVLGTLRSSYGDIIKSISFENFAEIYAVWSVPLNFKKCVYIDLGVIHKLTNGGDVGIFTGCSALTTVGSSVKGTLEEGVVNLKSVTTVNSMAKMFSGCSSMTEVILPTDSGITGTGANMFQNCSSLKSVIFPKTYRSIAENTFNGCTALEKVTLLATEAVTVDANAIPDREGLRVQLMNETAKAGVDAVGLTNTKVTLFDGAITLTGFAVRVEDYNGLRSFFDFDRLAQAEYETAGLTLVEYGGMISSKENCEAGGAVLVKSGNSYVPAHQKVAKRAVWENGNWAEGAKILDTSTDSTIQFALSLVNFEENYRGDVYFCGYSVWIDGDGNEYIVYEDYSDENADYKFVNLCDLCIAVYNGTDSYDAITNSEIINGILKTVGYLLPDGSKNEEFDQLALGWTPSTAL